MNHTIARSTSGLAVRVGAAVAVAAGGLVHLQLYFDGYRSTPDANLGRSFVVNGVASLVIAIALLARPTVLVRLAGLGLSLGTFLAFALSRTDRGVFGFTEHGFQPSPQAMIAVAVELAATALIVVTFVPAIGAGSQIPTRGVATAALALAGAAVVLSLLWAQDSTVTAADSSPGSHAVTVVDFSFQPSSISVPVGSTVTWTNEDAFAHSVVATGGPDATFRSDPLATGQTYSHTFDAPGTYTYICGIHPSMAGSVVVTE